MQSSIISELDAAVSSGSAEKRLQTLRRVTDLFLVEQNRLTEQQIGVFDDVLMHLIQNIETRALAQLSATLAPVGKAPKALVFELANNNEIAVAGPMLSQSPRLTDTDLIQIARANGQGHLLAISERSSLNPGVTDVLVERGNNTVSQRLAQNSGARFSEKGYSAIVKKAEMDGTLAESLGLRLDMPLNLLRELLTRATAVVRSRLLAASNPAQKLQIQKILETIVSDIARTSLQQRDFGASDGLVNEMNRKGNLNELILRNFALQRKYEEMVSALALLCQSKVSVVETLLKTPSPGGIAVACRSAGLDWQTVRTILEARFAYHSPSKHELDEAENSFNSLSESAAQRTIRFLTLKATVTK